MKRAFTLIALIAVSVLAGCRKQAQADSMAGMDMSDTASADSGMPGRAPVHLTPEQARARPLLG